MARYNIEVKGPDDSPDTASLVIGFPSVTEIVERTLAKPNLPSWYYKTGVEGFSTLLAKYSSSLPTDLPSLHSLMKSEGVSPYAVRDKASREGKKIHKAVEGLTKGRRPKDLPALTEYWKERGWKRANILASEQVVVSFKHRYAGRLDLVYEEDDIVTLTDIKSGEARDSHKLQLELYRRAWEELGNKPVDRLTIIQVPRDGSDCRELEVSDTLELREAGDAVLALWKWLKGDK